MTKTAEPKAVKSIRLPLDTWRQIDEIAQATGRSQSSVIDRAVDRMYRETMPRHPEPKTPDMEE